MGRMHFWFAILLAHAAYAQYLVHLERNHLHNEGMIQNAVRSQNHKHK